MEVIKQPEVLRQPSLVPTRTKRACACCRKNKAKCTGCFPTCERCLSKGLVCVYEPEKKKNKKNGAQHLKDMANQLQIEINVQKQLTEHWKRMLDQISPKASLDPASLISDIDFAKPVIISEKKISYQPFEFTEEGLSIINCVVGCFEDLGSQRSEISFEEAKNDWNFLANQTLTSADFQYFNIDFLVQLWERCFLFLSPSIYLSLEYQEQAIWNNCQILMRLVIWNKDLKHRPILIPKVIQILAGISKYYQLYEKKGASMSCLAIAYNMGLNSKEWVSDTLMDSLSIDLLMNTASNVERRKLINKIERKTLSTKLMHLRYIVVYCMSSLNINRFIDHTESDDLAMKLHIAESLADIVHGDFLGTFTKCQTFAMRSEVAYRQGYIALGDEWLNSCIETVSSISDGSVIQFIYSALILGKTSFLLPFKGGNKRSIIDEITTSLEKSHPNFACLDEKSKYPALKNLIHAFAFSPGIHLSMRRASIV